MNGRLAIFCAARPDSRVRLAIVAFLAGAETGDFSAVREAIKTTDGNASVHLRKLEDASYIAAKKRFVARKPQTRYTLTENGRKALLDYVAHLERLLPPGGVPKRLRWVSGSATRRVAAEGWRVSFSRSTRVRIGLD
jgi:DNA-binding transcriptional ArsR family regulator